MVLVTISSVQQSTALTVFATTHYINVLVNSAVICLRVVVLMGSASDKQHCEKIRSACDKIGIQCLLRVTSAHKGTEETLKILSKIEGEAILIPTVIIAVAGRSNGLGPVMSGNSCLPVINCPPMSAQWATSDIWSSLRLPSGLIIHFSLLDNFC